MNKNVNPVLAFAIILIFGGLIWLKFHLFAIALDVPKVSFIKKASGDTLALRLADKLYHYSAAGKLRKVTDLHTLGIEGGMGDFDFFSNGDLLINSDEYIRNLKENLAAYARMKNNNLALPKQGRGLFRCDLAAHRCKVFSDEIPEIQGAHFIHIDRNTDQVYLADTTRHAVRKLSAQGKLLAEIKTGLKFPNQVYLQHGSKADKLWVVDTNHHAMKAFKADTKDFGELIEEHKTRIDGEWNWPSAFTRLGKNWAVHIADHAMSNARVVLYDKHWNKMHELDLPKHADPVSSVFFDQRLILTDSDHYRLYQFDPYGNHLADFARDENTANGIQAALKANQALDKRYRQWSSWVLYFGIALFALFFAYAIKKEQQDMEEEQEAYAENLPKIEKENIIRLAKLPAEGEWIEARPYFKRIKWIALVFVLMSLISLAGLYFKLGDKIPLELIVMTIMLPIIFGLFIIPVSKIAEYKVGFFKNNVTIQTDKGKLISAPYHEIKWGTRFFMVGEWFIPIGTQNQSIFPFDALKEKLFPYLRPTNKVSEISALKLQWGSPEGLLKFVSAAGILVLLVIFLTKA